MTERKPHHRPSITLAAIQATDDLIAADTYWFAGGSRRIHRLLRQFGYEPTSAVAMERSENGHYSLAIAEAYDLDSEQASTVAVLGRAIYAELYGQPEPSRPRLLTEEVHGP